MQGTGQARVRVAALVALVLLLGVSLRGHPPGLQPANREPPGNNSASLLGMLALVTVCLLVIIVSIVASLRDQRRAKQAAREHVPGGAGGGTRRSWRFVLVIVAAILAWILVVALLAQLRLPQLGGGVAPAPPSTSPPGSRLPGGESVPRLPPPQPGDGDVVFWYLVIAMAVLLAVVLAGTVVLRIRGRRAPSPVPLVAAGAEPAVPGPGSLALAAERGLAEVGDLSREPREAIIACYVAMERALADAPGAAPQESDTPSEVLARAVEHEAIHAGSATELVMLFAEARFSTHVMNEGHRETAERALRLVLDELRSTV